MSAPRLLVATLMRPEGWCGVQTHFNAVCQAAANAGFQTSIVEPHQQHPLPRHAAAVMTQMLRPLSREAVVLWVRAAFRRALRAQLARALDRGCGPATVYAQDPLSASAAMDLRRRGRRFRLVGVVHYNISEAHEQSLLGNTREGAPLYRELLRRERGVLPQLDAVVFVSEFMRRTVRARVPELDRVPQFVLPNFPETPRRDLPPPAIEGDLLAIGTLEPRKNQGFLLQVLAEAGRRGRRYTLTLAGDGPSRGEYEALAQRLGVAAQVRFAGFVPGAARLLAAHRALVHSAHLENMPLTLVEALASGRPILAPAVGGIPEVYADGVEGRYWPLDDPAEAADRLIGVLEDPQVYARCAGAARQAYEQRFSREVLVPRWLAVLLGTPAPDCATRGAGLRISGAAA